MMPSSSPARVPGRADLMVARYLEEGILALRGCRAGEGEAEGEEEREVGTCILTGQGEYRDPRGLAWLLTRIASYYGVSLTTLRRQYARYLGRSLHIPVPLAEDVVLLPLRLGDEGGRPWRLPPMVPGQEFPPGIRQRETLQPKGDSAGAPGVLGYINGARVLRLEGETRGRRARGREDWCKEGAPGEGGGDSPFASRIHFQGGGSLPCSNALETVQERLRQGDAALKEFLRRQEDLQKDTFAKR